MGVINHRHCEERKRRGNLVTHYLGPGTRDSEHHASAWPGERKSKVVVLFLNLEPSAQSL
jgi:hypothetical protein